MLERVDTGLSISWTLLFLEIMKYRWGYFWSVKAC